MNQPPRDDKDQPTTSPHYRDPEVQGGRRAYFEAHGKWPPKGGKGAPVERYTVTFTPASPPPHAPTPVPFKTPEREAFDRAYASEQGLGPLSSKWELQGGKLTMVWLLGHHIGPQRPGAPRN